MATLHWAIEWDFAVRSLDRLAEDAVKLSIQRELIGKQLGPGDTGVRLTRVPVQIGKAGTYFTAQLERVEPPMLVVVDRATRIEVHLVDKPAAGSPSPLPGGSGVAGPSMDSELSEFILRQVVFDPGEPDRYANDLYDRLVGIHKEDILEELVGLLSPTAIKEEWSKRHYGEVLPLLSMMAAKAPVLVFGGDPGTGKTALATSIGAPLAGKLKERVHFRHMSLSMRGMGYQGRASTLIVKAFEQIRKDYSQVREPLLVFIDEAEAVVGSRQFADVSSGAQGDIAIVDAVIVGVDSLRKGTHARVAVIFATNLMGRMDIALMRRSYYHHFERPDENTRRALLESLLVGLTLSDDALDQLVASTKPREVNQTVVAFTHSDVVELIVGRALEKAIQLDQPLAIGLLLEYAHNTMPTGYLAAEGSAGIYNISGK